MKLPKDMRTKLKHLCRSKTVLAVLLAAVVVQQTPNVIRLVRWAGSDGLSRPADVSFVVTPERVVDRMLELAGVGPNDVVYDLGCGDGRIVITAAERYGCRAIGYDISARLVEMARANVVEQGLENRVRIERADIFTLDLSEASVITLYLLPDLNVRLIPQLDKLKPGVRIVSHNWDMKGVTPDEVVVVEDVTRPDDDHPVYLWTTPLRKDVAGADR